MEIVAEAVEVAGPHGSLLPPTSLRARTGELTLVTAASATRRTAMALALTGRLRPDRGSVRTDEHARRGKLRRVSTLVDAPGVTEPDGSLRLRDVVAEGLSLAGRRSGRAHVTELLRARGLQRQAGDRFENLGAVPRLEILLDLARANGRTRALVLDSPDRHDGDPASWHEPARRMAELGHAVVVLCTPQSAPHAPRIGSDGRAGAHPLAPPNALPRRTEDAG